MVCPSLSLSLHNREQSMYYQWIISIHMQTPEDSCPTLRSSRRGLWNSQLCCNPPLWASAWPPLVFASFKIEPLDLNVLEGGRPSRAPHMRVPHLTLGLLTFTSQVFYFENSLQIYIQLPLSWPEWKIMKFLWLQDRNNMCERDIVSEARSNS